MKLQADHLIMEALKEDISSEDVSTNAVMKEYVKGTMRPEVLGGIGGFSGAFSMAAFKGMEEPTLLSGGRAAHRQMLRESLLRESPHWLLR